MLERKTFGLTRKSVDLKGSSFEGFSAGIGNYDDQDDKILPGAFKGTIKERIPGGKVKWLDGHNPRSTQNLWGVMAEAEEKPYERPDGQKLGKEDPEKGLWSLTRVSTTDPSAQVALGKISEGILDALSIGFKPLDWQFVWKDPKFQRAAQAQADARHQLSGQSGSAPAVTAGEWDWMLGRAFRELKQVALWEHSAVVWGANEAALVIPGTVKAMVRLARRAEEEGQELDRKHAAEVVRALRQLVQHVPDTPWALREALGAEIPPSRLAGAVVDLVAEAEGLEDEERELSVELAETFEAMAEKVGPERILVLVSGAAEAAGLELPGMKGTVPPNVSMETAPEGQAWSKPALGDFTDKAWGDLKDSEKRKIAGHFAWAADMPPKSFGDLKFPHHDPKSGKVVFAACANAMGRLSGSSIPDGDKAKVKAHLARHYRQFGKDVPKAGDPALTLAGEDDNVTHQPAEPSGSAQVAREGAGEEPGRTEERQAEERKELERALLDLELLDLGVPRA